MQGLQARAKLGASGVQAGASSHISPDWSNAAGARNGGGLHGRYLQQEQNLY